MSKKPLPGGSWAACKQAVKNWPAPGLLGLIKELYDLSSDNRTFLHGRLLAANDEKTRAEIKPNWQSFSPPARCSTTTSGRLTPSG